MIEHRQPEMEVANMTILEVLKLAYPSLSADDIELARNLIGDGSVRSWEESDYFSPVNESYWPWSNFDPEGEIYLDPGRSKVVGFVTYAGDFTMWNVWGPSLKTFGCNVRWGDYYQESPWWPTAGVWLIRQDEATFAVYGKRVCWVSQTQSSSM